MDAKEYLSRAFFLNRQIKSKQKRLDWLKDIAPGPSMRFSEEAKVPGNPRSSAVENAAIRVVALRKSSPLTSSTLWISSRRLMPQ